MERCKAYHCLLPHSYVKLPPPPSPSLSPRNCHFLILSRSRITFLRSFSYLSILWMIFINFSTALQVGLDASMWSTIFSGNCCPPVTIYTSILYAAHLGQLKTTFSTFSEIISHVREYRHDRRDKGMTITSVTV